MSPVFGTYRTRLFRKWSAAEGKCYWCGQETSFFDDAETPERATLDHYYPKGYRPVNHQVEHLLACWQCNQKRANKTVEEMAFYRLIKLEVY